MKLKLSENSRSGLFCGPSVLLSFGISDVPNTPMYGVDIKYYLMRAGYMINSSEMSIHIQDMYTGTHYRDRSHTKLYPTMSIFIRYMYENGIANKYDVIFFSRGHVMAIKNGLLTDTAKMHGRTRVINYVLVEKKS